MEPVVYSSEPQLRSPAAFFREMRNDITATRGLGWRLFITNLRSQYRQSWLGYAWLVVPPLITSLIWVFLSRSKIVNTNTAEAIYPVFVVSGIFIWQTFVEALNVPLQQLNANRSVITKVKAPHEAFIVAGLAGVVFNFVLRMAVMAILIWVYGTGFHWTLGLVPAGILSVVILGLAIGLAFTPLGLLYNDVQHGLNAIAALWFFVTPIVYRIPTDEGLWQFLKYNPVTPLLVTTRSWMIGGGTGPEAFFLLWSALSALALLFGWIAYRLSRPHLISRLSS